MTGAPHDEVLEAFEATAEVLRAAAGRVTDVDRRVREVRRGRSQGVPYIELVTGANDPLVVDVISELLDGLLTEGSRLRRAEARALYAEGLSMDKIGHLLHVSRQRVSALINSPITDGAGASAPDRSRAGKLSLTDGEFRMMVDSVPHLMWVAGPDGSTEYLNQRGVEYTGQPAGTNYQTIWHTLIHPADRVATMERWERAMESGSYYELECRFRRHDGVYRWHRFRSSPVRGADGAVQKWIGTGIDVDEEKLLEALHASAPVPIALVDESFRVLHLNAAFAALHHTAPDEQVGMSVSALLPDLWPLLEPVLQEVGTIGAPVARDLVSGRWRVRCYPARAGSTTVGIGLAIYDLGGARRS